MAKVTINSIPFCDDRQKTFHNDFDVLLTIDHEVSIDFPFVSDRLKKGKLISLGTGSVLRFMLWFDN